MIEVIHCLSHRLPRALGFSFVEGNGFSGLYVPSLALAPLSFFLHPRSKGMILDVLNLGLPCFPFQLVG